MRRAFAVALGALLFAPLASAQVINTVAGGGPNNLPATAANLGFPGRVALDSGGNIYVTASNRVFKVDSSGTLTVVAGIGVSGFSGDGGPATNASLSGPSDVAVDGAGNVFIADRGNGRVRRVDAATGIISSIAPSIGSPGQSPTGVAVLSDGRVLWSDFVAHVIRRLDSPLVATVVAGTAGVSGFSGDGGSATAATLTNPFDVSVDAQDNIYIADLNNRRIRKVTAATGQISTVAGNGTFCNIPLCGEGGLAINAGSGANSFQTVTVDAFGNIFISDQGNNVVRRVDGVTGIITTVAGVFGGGSFSGDGAMARLAHFNIPVGMAFDAAGNLYVADSSNNRVRRVAPGADGKITGAADEIISTFAGNGSANFSGDGFAAIGAGVNQPGGAAVDSAGNLYFSDFGNRLVRRVDAVTGIISTYAGNGVSGFSGDGGPATSAALNAPLSIGFDSANNLYIPDNNNQRIRRVDAITGTITTVAGNGLQGFGGDGGPATDPSVRLNFPQKVIVDSLGNLYFSDFSNSRIRKVAGGIISTFAGTGATAYNGDGIPAITANLNGPLGIALDSAGNFYIAEINGGRVRKVDTSGIISTIAGTGVAGFAGDGGPATSAQLNPWDIAVDSAGNIFIAESNNQRIRRVDAVTHVITTVAGTGVFGFSGDGGSATLARLANPRGVALDASSRLFISDLNNNRIRRVVFDATPPVITPTVTGTLGNNGWYVSNVNVSWNVTDAESAVSSMTGCGSSSVTTDTAGTTFTCTATSAGGTASNSVTIKRDLTAPVLTLPGNINTPVTGGGGVVVSFTVTANDALTGLLTPVCAPTSGSTFTVGTTNVNCTATDPAGNSSSGSFTVTVTKLDQTITFAAIPAHTFGDASFALGATASSGLAVSYVASGNCSVVGNTVTITGAGACSVTASQAGNANYNAATDVVQSFNIAKFTPTVNVTGGTFTYDGNAHSATGSVTGVGGANLGTPSFTYNGSASTPANAGTFAVVGSFAGDANYNPASNSSASIVINKADQKITYGAALADKTYGDAPFTVSASSTSGLAVSFSASGNCTVAGNLVTITGAGSCTITTSQAGDSNWNAAPDAPQTFNIAKAAATIALSNLSYTFDGTPKSATATTSPLGLTTVGITYNGSPNPPTAAGNYAVVATLTNANYDAPNATDTLAIAKANQTISFGALANKTYGDAPFAVSASASSGLAVSFSIVSGPATISGGTITITGVGPVMVRASQGGDSNYSAAANVDQSFNVDQAASSTSLVSSVNPSLPGQSVTFTATVTSAAGTPGGNVEFFDGATSLGSVPLTGANAALSTSALSSSTHNITAVFSGNANFHGSTSAALSQTVIDNVPPVVTVPANMTVEATASSGATATFAASANDNVDGPLTPTCAPASGSTFALGTTTVTCSATDAAGNKGSAQFSITVRDTTPPVIAAHADVTASATTGTGAIVSYTPPSTSDLVDGAGIASCLPASGGTFALGNTTVTCHATDAAGNLATPTSFVVHVVDTTPPTIHCAAPDGLWHTSDVSINCTASDNGSGLANASDASFSLSTSVAPGIETANAATGTRNVCDNAGNCATAGPIGGNKVDKKGPSITLNAPANNAVYILNQSATASFSCADSGSGPGTCAGTVANGAAINTSSVGTKSFTVTATDAVGNPSSLTYTYKVVYASGGVCNGDVGHSILQPINADGSSVWKQGSTVPSKFRVCDATGASIGTPGVVANFAVYQIQAGTITTVDESPASTTPDTQFRWDSSGQQWIFNVSTKQSPVNVANRTYYFRIDLNDGTSILFQFGLK